MTKEQAIRTRITFPLVNAADVQCAADGFRVLRRDPAGHPASAREAGYKNPVGVESKVLAQRLDGHHRLDHADDGPDTVARPVRGDVNHVVRVHHLAPAWINRA